MKKQIFLGLIIFVGTHFLLTNCSPSYYFPNAHNVPLLFHKGEGTLTLTLGGSEYVNSSVEGQGAYAITNNFALMTNFCTAWGKREDYGSGYGSLVELGAGYFKPVSSQFVFETYAGGGPGGVTNYFEPDKLEYSKLRFTKLFIQPAFGYKAPLFNIALSLRGVNLNYYAFQNSYLNTGGKWTYYSKDPNYYLLEPALTLRGGLPNIKLQLQLGLSYNMTDPEFKQEIYNINLGLFFRLNTNKNTK